MMVLRSFTRLGQYLTQRFTLSRPKLRTARSLVSLFLVTVFLSVVGHWVFAAKAETFVRSPLSTQGSQIVDASGETVLLRGVNWFGFETDQRVAHGLWARDYKEMLAQIKQLGYNIVRLPFSLQSLRSAQIQGVNYAIGSNRDLQGTSPLQALDLIIQEAQRQGLMILLDQHRLNESSISELWYGDGFTEADWIETWKQLATRYRNQSNVIGADLKNEPHGSASWGTNNQATDWRLAAERAGNAILSVNPDWLIVVEGVERNVPGQQLTHWWGGNLEGVRNAPVRLSQPNKLVYSPHEYGAGVYNQSWFYEPNFPTNLRDRWEIGFNYIATQNTAPILIGEFGGRQVDAASKEGIWQRELVSFLQAKKLNFTYWSWNPNSSDTGGILQDDWRTVNSSKQALLNQLLPVAGLQPTIASPLPTPSPSPSPPPSPTPDPTPNPAPTLEPIPLPTPELTPLPTPTQLTLQGYVRSDWQTGFCYELQVTNRGSLTSTRSWQLSFQMNQADINNSWNGSYLRRGNQYTMVPPEWARTIDPNQTVNLGFCANKQGTDYQPRQLTLE